MKKIGIYLVYVLAVVFIMLAFACGTIAFAELGYSAFLPLLLVIPSLL